MPQELSREVGRLALPAILHSLLQTLVFVVDRVMLGRHGEASLAAMQLGGAFEWSIWSVFAAFVVGTIARVGRHVGAGDRSGACLTARLSFIISLVCGVCVALSTPLVLGALPLIAQRLSPEGLAETRGYLGVTIVASPVVFVAASSTATLQASGDTRTPLAIGVFANLVHVALNRVLILGGWGVAAMGARGAGISTAVTFTLEAVLMTLALTSSKRPVSLMMGAPPPYPRPYPRIALRCSGRGPVEALHPRSTGEATPAAQGPDVPPRYSALRAEARELFRVGAPAFLERGLYHVGYVAFALVIARLGDAVMAAHQSLISVESICFLSADGFGVAAAAMVAQKLGAAKPEEARRAAWIATRYAVTALTVFGLCALLLRDIILPIFSTDSEVIRHGRAAMPVLALAQPFMATAIVFAQSLRGAGRTRQALGVSFFGGVVVRLTATWLLAITAGLGLVGVWLGSTTDWLVRTIALSVMFRNPSFVRTDPAGAISPPGGGQTGNHASWGHLSK